MNAGPHLRSIGVQQTEVQQGSPARTEDFGICGPVDDRLVCGCSFRLEGGLCLRMDTNAPLNANQGRRKHQIALAPTRLHVSQLATRARDSPIRGVLYNGVIGR